MLDGGREVLLIYLSGPIFLVGWLVVGLVLELFQFVPCAVLCCAVWLTCGWAGPVFVPSPSMCCILTLAGLWLTNG